jgi:Armadillo/beta-catenin-like repeat
MIVIWFVYTSVCISSNSLLIDAGILPHLAHLIEYDEEKMDILTEICWVLTYLTAWYVRGDFVNFKSNIELGRNITFVATVRRKLQKEFHWPQKSEILCASFSAADVV